ncbi:MAG: c-type cytochrome biogenesis protein CcmI [Gammaproteobacteria bacterium]
MTVFLISIVVMIIVAFVLILPPLFRKNFHIDQESIQNEQNLAIGREHLSELKKELDSGRIDKTQFEQARSELEIELSQVMTTASETTNGIDDQNRTNNTALIFLLLMGLPIISIAIYLQTGSLTALDVELQKTEQALSEQSPDIETMVAELAERLESDPNDGESWSMLGKSYVAMNRFSEAREAFSKAYEILGDNVPLLADYADSIGRSRGSDLTGDAKPLIVRGLEVDPDYPKLRWLAGMLAYQEQEYQKVSEFLQPILMQTKPGSEVHESLKRLIAEAQSQSKGSSVSTQDKTVHSNASLQVKVSLDGKLSDQVHAEDTVFVFAKAVQGPPIPLAVAKIKVSKLPTTVILDDSMAMRPDLKISAHQRVTISARISKSGNAIAASGDLEAKPVEVDVETLKAVGILIDRVLP